MFSVSVKVIGKFLSICCSLNDFICYVSIFLIGEKQG
jgi:hypothetical protein